MPRFTHPTVIGKILVLLKCPMTLIRCPLRSFSCFLVLIMKMCLLIFVSAIRFLIKRRTVILLNSVLLRGVLLKIVVPITWRPARVSGPMLIVRLKICRRRGLIIMNFRWKVVSILFVVRRLRVPVRDWRPGVLLLIKMFVPAVTRRPRIKKTRRRLNGKILVLTPVVVLRRRRRTWRLLMVRLLSSTKSEKMASGSVSILNFLFKFERGVPTLSSLYFQGTGRGASPSFRQSS